MRTNDKILVRICRCRALVLAASALLLAIGNSNAQTKVLVNSFVDTNEVADVARGGGDAWGNWYGLAYIGATWDSSDASNDVNSGSLKIQAYFPNAGLGGCCGEQFLVINGFNGFTNSTFPAGIPGNGNADTNLSVATNVSFDIRFDSASAYATNFNTWPWIEVGTRDNAMPNPNAVAWASDFGSYSHNNTNWLHRSYAIGANTNWSFIRNIYFKHYDTGLNNFVTLYIDNIEFTIQDVVTVVPPRIAIQKPTRALRVFAGSTAQTYDREQVTSVDTNQSWVGGSYPVSYSFKLLSFPVVPTNQEALFRYHIFLVPVNYAGGNSFVNNEYIEYQAADDLWLNVSAQTNVAPGSVVAEVAWKTNLPNANPNNIALTITNPTAVGTWTLTFSNANSGALTAPGASPKAFTIPADAAARFANPLVAFFGVQPDSGWGEGQYTDVAQIQTVGVASPGVPINTDFTTATSIDTNIWDVSNSAQPSSLVLVGSNAAWWVYWTFPDYSSVLGTKADLSTTVPWKTPAYYTGYQSNSVFQAKMGNNIWALVPSAGLPSQDGLSNSVKAARAFFRVSSPGPTE